MSAQDNFRKEWPKIKKQLLQMSKEAVELAKKGEKQLIKASRRSKLHIDSTALNLKREHLYHHIGKEYVSAKCPGEHTSKLKKLLVDLEKIEKQIKTISSRIKPTKVKRKTGLRKKKSQKS